MSQPATHLDSFSSLYPLPVYGSALQTFSETANVHGVPIHLAGFAVDVDGECITGSAADTGETPSLRAYMELLERLSLLTAMRRSAPLTLRDAEGARAGLAPAAHVFPHSLDPERWKWARSNGVAIAATWGEAARRARWELLERDRVLRSFYGEIRPRHAPLEFARIPRVLRAHFSFRAYWFQSSADDGAHVAAVFGFPRGGDPLVYGFGARDSLDGAVAAAAGECLQRLGFLFGEALPESPPAPAPTPDFHQEYFLFPAHHERLRRWLRGEHATHRGSLRVSEVPEEPVYADLTPPALEGRLFVAKALPRGHVPLAFGVGHPMLRADVSTELPVHPIA